MSAPGHIEAVPRDDHEEAPIAIPDEQWPDSDGMHHLPEPQARLLLKPTEAASRLSIGVSTLYRLMDRGEIVTVTIGRSRRIRTADLEAWVASLPES